mmetsp:Transcript_2935/g.12094  ORF Transcript_2935/g.12094 Transcript_2935/m.12094 type:complete len:207 (+) Transcript_2935:1054-1674(+)
MKGTTRRDAPSLFGHDSWLRNAAAISTKIASRVSCASNSESAARFGAATSASAVHSVAEQIPFESIVAAMTTVPRARGSDPSVAYRSGKTSSPKTRNVSASEAASPEFFTRFFVHLRVSFEPSPSSSSSSSSRRAASASAPRRLGSGSLNQPCSTSLPCFGSRTPSTTGTPCGSRGSNTNRRLNLGGLSETSDSRSTTASASKFDQ